MAKEVFNRVENKYIISAAKKNSIIAALQEYMEADKYNIDGRPYTISNIYYDTKDNYLIQNSVSKPVYKEKLRLRGYGIPKAYDLVFLEIKKKYKGVVNKRRTRLSLEEAKQYIKTREIPEIKPYMNLQVLREIQYFMSIYDLEAKLYLAYDRLAFFDKDDGDFRVSFDTNIRTRRYDLTLDAGDYGEKMFDDDIWLMEVKINKNLPLWFARVLAENEVYQNSFSKYGTEYARLVGKGRIEHSEELRSIIL